MFVEWNCTSETTAGGEADGFTEGFSGGLHSAHQQDGEICFE